MKKVARGSDYSLLETAWYPKNVERTTDAVNARYDAAEN